MVNPESEFRPVKREDTRTASIVEAMFNTAIGADRKSVLDRDQAVLIARARAYANSFQKFDADGNEIEPPLVELHAFCDYLENTSVSIGGRGLKDITAILTAQSQGDRPDDMSQMLKRFQG